MDRAKESIENTFGNIKKEYEKMFEIIDTRWNGQPHRPLYATDHLLNSGLFYKATKSQTLSPEVMEGYLNCIDKMVPDVATHDILLGELSRYKAAVGMFGCGQVFEWWSLFGCQTPTLQKFVMKVLILTCSSSGCERNWSVFEHIHSKKRNRLVLSRLNDPVYIKYNRTLASRYNARDTIDPIALDYIDEANEWLLGCPEDQEDELVYEGDDLDWEYRCYDGWSGGEYIPF
ncbi:unnamed protein product [Withania somnifera]